MNLRTVATSTTAILAVAIVGLAPHASAEPQTRAPIFLFENRSWINLHHFLYVLGRASAGEADAKRAAVADAPRDAASAPLTDDERRVWDRAVARYAGAFSKRDLVFDATAFNATNAIARVADGGSPMVTSVPAEIRDALIEVMPLYEKHWWPAHAEANRKRVTEFYALIGRHGRAIVERLTRLYVEPWPAGGVRVQIAAYTNWAGAYSTRGPLLVVASLPSAHDGTAGLEILFHEAMHQWDDQMDARLRRIASATGRAVPPDLTHAMIFYTAGHVTRAVVGETHTTYAEANGIWQRGLGRFRTALDAHWKPYLDGATTIDEALTRLLASFPK